MKIIVTDIDNNKYVFNDFYQEDGEGTYLNNEDDACFSIELSDGELYFWKDDGDFEMTIIIKSLEIMRD